MHNTKLLLNYYLRSRVSPQCTSIQSWTSDGYRAALTINMPVPLPLAIMYRSEVTPPFLLWLQWEKTVL